MRKFGLIGYPLGHSFSKKYFTEKFSREEIVDAVYDTYPLENLELFPELVENTEGLKGLNVTIPYKTSILKFLSETDSDSTAAGAVNVIKISKDPGGIKLKGFNTDIYGFRESLLPLIGSKGYSALVLGTGGSSLAVRYVLEILEIDYISVSRISSEKSITYTELTDDHIRENELIINTTPLGMFPDIDSCPDINYDVLTKKHILFDLVYNPEMTKFLQKGKDKSCKVKNGLEMLHLQAERSWMIWNGTEF